MLFSLKKFFLLLTSAALLLSYGTLAFAQPPAESIIDDSLRDMSLVIGSGAVGAVLGLSTLSFVDTPSKHLKNIAVGGAIGIVVGVAVVIFSQATRSSSAITENQSEIPMNPEKFADLSRQEFSQEKIVKNFQKQPSVGYSFSF